MFVKFNDCQLSAHHNSRCGTGDGAGAPLCGAAALALARTGGATYDAPTECSTHSGATSTAPIVRCQPPPSAIRDAPSLRVCSLATPPLSASGSSALGSRCHWPTVRTPPQPLRVANVAPLAASTSNACSAYLPSFGGVSRTESTSPGVKRCVSLSHSMLLPSENKSG